MARYYKWKDKVATLLSIKGKEHIYYCDGYLPEWYLYDYEYIRKFDKDIRKFDGRCYILLYDSIDHHKIYDEYWKSCMITY